MLERLFGILWGGGRRRRRDGGLAGRILARLERDGVLVLDAPTLAELGAGKRRVFRAVCDLVIRERMHLWADAEGYAVVMSNPEFERSMRHRASLTRETEIRRRDGNHILVGQHKRVEEPAEAPPGEAVRVDAVPNGDSPDDLAGSDLVTAGIAGEETATVLFSDWPLDNPSDYDWFQIEVAPAGDDGETKLPAIRQTLPERRREPWPMPENAELEDG